MSDKQIKLIVTPESQPSRSVMILCKMVKLPHEIIKIDVFDPDDRSDILQPANPKMQVPVLQHGSLNIAESTAIFRYINNLVEDKSLFNYHDLTSRILTENFFVYYHQNVRPITRLTTGQIFMPDFLKKFFDVEKDIELTEKILLMLVDNYPSISSGYILGERFSICDILLFCEIMQLNLLGYDIVNKHPQVWAYLQRCSKGRPELREAHFENEKLARTNNHTSWFDLFNL